MPLMFISNRHARSNVHWKNGMGNIENVQLWQCTLKLYLKTIAKIAICIRWSLFHFSNFFQWHLLFFM